MQCVVLYYLWFALKCWLVGKLFLHSQIATSNRCKHSMYMSGFENRNLGAQEERIPFRAIKSFHCLVRRLWEAVVFIGWQNVGSWRVLAINIMAEDELESRTVTYKPTEKWILQQSTVHSIIVLSHHVPRREVRLDSKCLSLVQVNSSSDWFDILIPPAYDTCYLITMFDTMVDILIHDSVNFFSGFWRWYYIWFHTW